MTRSTTNSWLHRFAVLTAIATLLLIGIGGVVTSHEAGLAVPDWPSSYGYNMFFFPIAQWWHAGNIFYEHSHRLFASGVGLLVVALTRWLGGSPSRRPLMIVGLAETLAGIAILVLRPDLKQTGHFLMGIGGVILLAALVWVRHAPAKRPLVLLGWLAFVLVQVQGLLGGLRVVWLKDEIGIFHATLAQFFFILLCAIALLTSKWWIRAEQRAPAAETPGMTGLRRALIATTVLIFLQLILGATMRHQHAGLAIPDFPLAHGQLWPALDADSIAAYNRQRPETALNSITAFHIVLQMVHRIAAVLIAGAVLGCCWSAARQFSWRSTVTRLAGFWLGLIIVQAGLGVATVLSQKAADFATAHVLGGALSLAVGAMLSIFSLRAPEPARNASALSNAGARAPGGDALAPGTATT